LARAALRVAEVNLESTNIPSPADGMVMSQAAAPGKEVILGDSQPLFTVADTRVVEIRLRAAAWAADTLRLGEKVLLSAGLLPGRAFQGEVTQISRVPEAADGTSYDLVILVSNPQLLLKPGMSTLIHMTPGEVHISCNRKRLSAAS
jgi:HlyD family secretion protein